MFGYLSRKNTPDVLEQRAAYLSHLMLGATAGHSLPEQDFPYKGYCKGRQSMERDGLHVTVHGEPHWSDAGRSPATPASIASAFEQKDTSFLVDLHGGFSLAILHRPSGYALLAVDKMGIERLAYAQSTRELIFSNNAESVARFPEVGYGLRHQAFVEYLYLHMIPSPGTIFENVLKLPPASILIWDRGESRRETYWAPDFTRRAGGEFTPLRDNLHRAVETAVATASPDAATGAFLSGGLDSSTVAGKLSQATNRQTKTFSIGFGEAEYDELQYARISSRHFGCIAYEYHVTPSDIVRAFPIVADAFDEPFGNSSAVPTYFCAKLAAENGVNHLLAGDGGDELFAGNERYARQAVFEMYTRIPAWLRHGLLDRLSQRIPADGGITPLRKWRSYVDQANIPLPDRFESWNLLFREDVTNLLTPEFAHSVNLQGPLEVLRNNWRETQCDSLLDHMLAYDWRLTLADNDLRKVSTMCESAGVRVSYPLLHEDVVDASIQVPSSMKMSPLNLRKFYKKAMRGFLPPEVITKKKHGFGLPFGVWLKTDDQLADLVYSNLSDLKKRRIVSRQYLDELIDAHRTGHSSYYGYVIWDLAMLEEWLRRHAQTY